MKLLVINPVGYTNWDEQDRRIYRRFARPGSEVTVVSLPKGPPSLETARAYRQAVPLVIETAKKTNQDFDAVVVNCYLDPGVDALKKILPKPVVGPCEASLAMAAVIGTRIGIVSVQGAALSMIRSRVEELGRHNSVKSVIGMPMGVLDLYEDSKLAEHKLIQVANRTIEKYRLDVICLGCTGLGGLAENAQHSVGVPIIDPVGAAVELATAAVDLNLYSTRSVPKRGQKYSGKFSDMRDDSTRGTISVITHY